MQTEACQGGVKDVSKTSVTSHADDVNLGVKMEKEKEEGDTEGDSERRKKVGHYVLGPCLGEGSYAKVRIGTHIISREKVAVKIVSKRVIIRRDAARRNFRREALLLQHVCHPHIIRLFEAMETPNSYYLVFELANHGHLLGYVTSRKCLTEGESRRFMRQMVSAVDHLHRSGIVHRDLKLENCLLNTSLDIKITDFGLSALCQRESGLHTQCGSPAYAAPEIFGNRRYGPAVDLWSLGVCLYAMVVGRLPFLPHPPTNLPQLHALILKGASIPTFLSPGLQLLLAGLLEVQESRRLSISDLLHQSWLTSNRSQPITRVPPVSKAPPPPIDTAIIKYMTSVFRFNESDVIHSVTDRKLNASSATYQLLKRHTEEEKSHAEENAKNAGHDTKSTPRDRGAGSEYTRSSVASSYSRSVVSDFSRPTTRSKGPTDGTRSTASDYVRSLISRGSQKTVKSESCALGPVPRSNLQTLITSRSQPAESKDSGPMNVVDPKADPQQVANSYKKCILYLKEARHSLALNGRSLAHLQRDLVDKGTTRLPFLNLHNRPTPHHAFFHASLSRGSQTQSSDSHPSVDNSRQHVLSPPGQDLKLNVMGRPALLDRGNKGDNYSVASSSHVSVTSQDTGKPPPPPPNTAQGRRILAQASSEGESGSAYSMRPSTTDSCHSDLSLKDPFSRDTWRNVFQNELRLGGEMDAGDPRKGVSFVAPLSSPKALISRDDASRKHNYFLVRQLAADLNRKRSSPASRKASPLVSRSFTTHTANLVLDDDDSDDDHKIINSASRPSTTDRVYGMEGQEKERFLTPVIRVTITSTAKQ